MSPALADGFFFFTTCTTWEACLSVYLLFVWLYLLLWGSDSLVVAQGLVPPQHVGSE